jgi:hypothetical protein
VLTVVADASLGFFQGNAVDWKALWSRDVASLLDLDHNDVSMARMQYPCGSPLMHINILQTTYAWTFAAPTGSGVSECATSTSW